MMLDEFRRNPEVLLEKLRGLTLKGPVIRKRVESFDWSSGTLL